METNPPTPTSPGDSKPKPAIRRKPKSPDKPTGKRSLNLSVPIEDYERLAIHAMRGDTTISELVCRLAREHLREYHITRTPTRE